MKKTTLLGKSADLTVPFSKQDFSISVESGEIWSLCEMKLKYSVLNLLLAQTWYAVKYLLEF